MFIEIDGDLKFVGKSKYSNDILTEICDAIVAGATLVKQEKKLGYPAYKLIRPEQRSEGNGMVKRHSVA